MSTRAGRRSQRTRACGKKSGVYRDRELAEQAAESYGAHNPYAPPKIAYRCRWCPRFHIGTAPSVYTRLPR